MRLRLIGCEVFTREVCYCVARSPHRVDIEFTTISSHDNPDSLRQIIQAKIDSSVESRNYDAILLCFGLCGNSTLNIQAREIPIIIPRAHDCCTIFLGSKLQFKDHFGDKPSSRFTSTGYMEYGGDTFVHDLNDTMKQMGSGKSYDDYVKEYGEECAKFIYETLHAAYEKLENDNTITFIDIPETRHLGFASKCKKQAIDKGKEFVQLSGSIGLIEKLIYGDWKKNDFLVVKPGYRIFGVYDLIEIVRAEKTEKT
jgi:hypothetical protein